VSCHERGGQAPTCRGIRPSCVQPCAQVGVCPDCQFLHEQQFEAPEDLNFLRHCRAIRHYVDQGTSPLFSPYVAAFLVAANGQVQDIDRRSVSFLQSSGVLFMRNNRVSALNNEFNDLLIQAIDQVAATGEPKTLICSGNADSLARYAILLQLNQGKVAIGSNIPRTIACLMLPLGRRRVASTRQLMSMFGLSPAEARLARALCHGERLEEYADAQGVKLPTVKTQLRAVFAKTQTDRQVSLVSLIAAIPPLR
jgi:DNA-binding CsgD family transcriptional regulator